MKKTLFSLFLSLLATGSFIVGCTKKKGGGEESSSFSYEWNKIGHEAGYITDILFHPVTTNEIWLSGDDGGGIYKSQDGGTSWTQIETTPKNLTSHAIVIDPADPQKIYAPNRFGRGFSKSTDGGTTWTVVGTGLPTDVSDNTAKEKRRFEELVMDPNSASTLYGCLQDGVYKSTDSGDQFTKLTNLPDTSACVSMTISKGGGATAGTLFVGTAEAGIYKTTDGGDSWTTVNGSVGNTCTPVSSLSLTNNALYAAFNLGRVAKTATFSSPLTDINSPDGAACSAACSLSTCSFHSLHWTKIVTASGSSAATDIIYAGTVNPGTTTKFGLHKSSDGGSTWSAKNSGLEGYSVQSLALNPSNSQHIIYGSMGNGIYNSSDGGSTWTNQRTGLKSTIAIGISEDPSDKNHLLASGTVGLGDGTGGFYETVNNGSSWSKVSSFSGDAIAISISPQSASDILISGWKKGIYRSTKGTSGPWTQDTSIFPKDVNLSYIVRDSVNSSKVYASATFLRFPTTVSANNGIYYSSNNGESWSQVVSHSSGYNPVPHPTKEGEALAVGDDVFATTTSFSSMTSLGLKSSIAPSTDFFISAAFDPSNTSTVLVGSATGKIYLTENYSSSGASITWRELTTPAKDVFIRRIIITPKGWLALCWMGDMYSTPDSTEGILFSSDRGENWQFLSQGMGVSQLVYDFLQSPSDANRFVIGMWDGGVMTLDLK